MSTPVTITEYAELRWNECGEPYSEKFDDVYFSTDSGLAETRYVFLEGNDLPKRFQALDPNKPSTFIIAETGFGSGLNFLATLKLWQQYAPHNWRLHFLSGERYPLRLADLKRCCALWPELEQQAESLIRLYPVCTPGFHRLNIGNISLTLMIGEADKMFAQLLSSNHPQLQNELASWQVDAWFLDGFTPSKNPSLWQDDLMAVITALSKPGTTLSTFSVSAIVKTALKKQGFRLDKRKGFGRKREMLTAKLELSADYEKPSLKLHSAFDTPWTIHRPCIKEKTALVIGSGLAGSHMAYQLVNRGFSVTVLEKGEQIAVGASGNPDGVLFAKLSPYQSPWADLYLAHFLYAARFYRQHDLMRHEGMIKLAYNDKEQRLQQSLAKVFKYYPELGRLINAEQGSILSGVSLHHQGAYFPLAGVLSPPEVCAYLLAHEGIDVKTGVDVDTLTWDGQQWSCAGYEAETVVIASGEQSVAFSQANFLPIKPVAGQLSCLPESEQSKNLSLALCADGYIAPSNQGIHSVGATFLTGGRTQTKAQGNSENIKRLAGLSAVFTVSEPEPLASRQSVRATTPDYLPMVGGLVEPADFCQQYRIFSKDANAFVPERANYLPNGYVFTGFGSNGLTYTPLASEYLACVINNEPSPLASKYHQHLNPARFLVRQICRGTAD